MTRSVPEWIGKTHDTPIPMRVKFRVFTRCKGACQGNCGRKLTPADKWDCDHIQALINGGENRESNLQVLCSWCHKKKTKQDIKVKAKTQRMAKKHVGIRSRSRFANSRDGYLKTRLTTNGPVTGPR